MARGSGSNSSAGAGGGGESKRREGEPAAATATALPLRYGGTYQYQSLETAAPIADDTAPMGTTGTGRLFGRRLLASPAGLLLSQGGALIAVGLLCGLGVGVLVGRGGGGAPSGGGAATLGAQQLGGAGKQHQQLLPVLGNAFSPQVIFMIQYDICLMC